MTIHIIYVTNQGRFSESCLNTSVAKHRLNSVLSDRIPAISGFWRQRHSNQDASDDQ